MLLRPCFCVCVRASASESVLLRVRPPVCVSARASACPSVLLRVRPPACVSSVRLQVGTLNIRASSAWVEKSSRRVLRLDERTRTFEVYYIYYTIHRLSCGILIVYILYNTQTQLWYTNKYNIIQLVDSISRDERDAPLTNTLQTLEYLVLGTHYHAF